VGVVEIQAVVGESSMAKDNPCNPMNAADSRNPASPINRGRVWRAGRAGPTGSWWSGRTDAGAGAGGARRGSRTAAAGVAGGAARDTLKMLEVSVAELVGWHRYKESCAE